MEDLPIITLRRLEANVIKPIYEEMVSQLGLEKARDILGKAIRKDAIRHGQTLAAGDGPGGNDLAGFAALLPN